MIKKIIFTLSLLFLFSQSSFSAGSSDSSKKNIDINYKKAVKLIKKAKKLDKKNDTKKAKDNYQKALEYLVVAFNKNANDADTLNYLGYTSRKLEDYKNAELYYLMGLKIDPKHFGINEYLGELYVITNRKDKAKERLKVLENCDCKEYKELKNAINTGNSKY
jgi:tetratricopeptide (TPR) repeat protein|tara:strand:+ start:273 stop:761 length:489 start_codon:yes stop_codon:yes gene_type:complete